MNGPVETALMIVAAGNAYLAGKDIRGFWPDAPTFRFMKACEFRLPPASGNDADDFPLVAADPIEWFESLKGRASGLRLLYGPSVRGPNQQLDVPDRMLSGFVGGGGRWMIEAVTSPESELWEGFHRTGDRDEPDQRIWLCTHIMQGTVRVTLPENLPESLAKFRAALASIEAYAREQTYDNFPDCFARAREALDRKGSLDADWVREIQRYTKFGAEQMNVFEAIRDAWVFGGMGSWNDLGEGGERYDKVSEDLYLAINAVTCGLANSTYRAGLH